MTVESIAKKVEAFVKRRFRNCKFDIEITENKQDIIINLSGGDFTPYVVLNSGSRLYCHVTVHREGFFWGYAEALDSSLVSAHHADYYTLTKESEAVFKELVDFIKKSFSKIDYVKFVFVILRPDSFDKGARPGTISKPTKIDHKTAKRPRRRSVAEAILGRGIFL